MIRKVSDIKIIGKYKVPREVCDDAEELEKHINESLKTFAFFGFSVMGKNPKDPTEFEIDIGDLSFDVGPAFRLSVTALVTDLIESCSSFDGKIYGKVNYRRFKRLSEKLRLLADEIDKAITVK